MSTKNPSHIEKLIEAIVKMPPEWALTLCVGKKNLWPAWNTAKLDHNLLIDAIANQRNHAGKHTAWTGVSLVTGPMSGGVMAIDFDGEAALPKYEELSGGVPLPVTRMWTSGKPGHFQVLLRVPQAQWSDLKPLKFHILNAKHRENLGLSQEELAQRLGEGVRPEQIAEWESGSLQPIPPAIGKKIAEIFGMADTDPTEKLEFRWNQCSTLPPSIHPDTKSPYYWENWDENYDWENWQEFVPIAPDWAIDLMRGSQHSETQQSKPQQSEPIIYEKSLSDILESDILPRLDAESFYGERVKLKKVGKNLVGLCPFHDENTGSFTVSSDTKLFKCFGCDAGGGPVQFLHQIGGGSGSPSGKDFVEVVRQLGDRVGVSLPDLGDVRSKFSSQQQPKAVKSSLTNNGGTPLQETATATLNSIEEAIDFEINSGVIGSRLSVGLNKIAAFSKFGIREIRQIYDERVKEKTQAEDREDTASEIAQLLASKSAKLDIAEILPGTLAQPIKKMAQKMSLRAECYLLALLTQCASLLPASTQTMLHPPTNYRVRPNYFGATIAESGEGKSPVGRAIITDPMAALLDKAKADYENALAAYDVDFATWNDNKNKEDRGPAPVAPVRKVYYFTKQTGEGIAAQAGRMPEQGMLYYCDELASLFKSANQYRGGKGSDEEDLLEYWSGGGATVLRAGGLTVDVRNVSLSIFGNIQPKVLAKFMGDGEDNNGKFARFDFIRQPPTITRLSGDSTTLDLSPMLTSLYQNLDNLSINYFELDKAAHDLFTSFYDSCSERKFAHPKQGMRAMLGKAPEKVGKIATILHCIQAAHHGTEVPQYISADSVRGAIKFVQYTIDQALSISTEGEAEAEASSLAPNLLKILELAERKGGSISARDTSKSFTSKNRPTTQQVSQWFGELAELKYGEVTTKGTSFLFTLCPQSPPPPADENQESVIVSVVPDSDSSSPPPPPAEDITGGAGNAAPDAIPEAVPGVKTSPDKGLEPVGGAGDDFLSNLVPRVRSAQTWAEVEAVWNGNEELKARIKAALTREELARIGRLYKAANPSNSEE
ncbi:DUF3987 domain-containing protein [Microcoleus sp. MON2_D5]|uniref:DUF3987 domain-containing protein n=1 Tax=Microcoleus sp. MON2_D5 TaxID=2818833 RepID=UPI002FD2029F